MYFHMSYEWDKDAFSDYYLPLFWKLLTSAVRQKKDMGGT